jgi:hypothetical protein
MNKSKNKKKTNVKSYEEKPFFRGPLDGQIEAESKLAIMLGNYLHYGTTTPPNTKKKRKNNK